MPSRREVIKKIEREAARQKKTFKFDEEGKRHTHYRLEGTLIPIPRHRSIDNDLAEIIYRECVDHLGKGWWRK